MKIVNESFSKMKNFWVKYLLLDQTIYQEQMYTRLLNLVNNHCNIVDNIVDNIAMN